ncbi:farnesol dehydrogenase-like [Chironomus tepperi]|uniref:farnesol dehydrogenase-like n=1 Tax=Chironomus tepperi TaxID=113505 RepID=UPI00391F055E
MDKWKNKIAVITGASSGIGLAILKDLAINGITVIGLARNVKTIETFKSDLGVIKENIFTRTCDVSNADSLRESFEWIEKEFSFIHILINNAGILHNLSILDSSDEATEKINSVINTNFTGAVHCARKAINLMKKSNDYGLVININSIAGHSVYSGLNVSNVYSPTKFALTAFTEILRQELIINGNDKIRVSNLSPGVVKTEIMVRGKIYTSEDTYNDVPHIYAEDISQGVLYLLSTPCNVNVTQLTIKPLGERK